MEPAASSCGRPGKTPRRVLVDQRGRSRLRPLPWWMGVRRNLAEGMGPGSRGADIRLAACLDGKPAKAKRLDSVALAIPPEGPAAMAAAYAGGQMIGVYTRGGDFMGRGARCWPPAAAAATLAARVRAARLPFQGRLTFRTDESEGEIVLTENDVLVDVGRTARSPSSCPRRRWRGCARRVRSYGRAGAPTDPARPGSGRCAACALSAADAAHLPDGPILSGTSSVALAPASRSLCSLCSLRTFTPAPAAGCSWQDCFERRRRLVSSRGTRDLVVLRRTHAKT